MKIVRLVSICFPPLGGIKGGCGWACGFFLSLLMFAASSCLKQDDIYKQFIVPNGYVYPGIADSLTTRSGLRRVEVTWLTNADPLVNRTRFYCNDSLIHEASTIPNQGRDTAIIPLDEGVYVLQVRNVNEQDIESVPKEIIVEAMGNRYLANLTVRADTAFRYDGTTLTIKWDLPNTAMGMAFTTLTYTDIANPSAPVVRTYRVENSENMTTLTGKIQMPVTAVTTYEIVGGLDFVETEAAELQ